ncbi:MAG: polymorphic toxin type 15 domain-containing protein [Coprococcus phoceensis]
MGYHVKIEELLEIQSQMLNQLSEWGTQLATVYQALETIVVTPCIQGETGKSIQNYIQEVHIPVIGSLQQLLTEFQVRLSVYAEGYYGIDSSYEAEIPQEILEEQQQVLEKGREDFENLREEINSIISNVSDIVSVVQPSGLSLVLSYQLMESRVKTLNSDIGDYEETHQNDTQNMDSMMESIRSILIARTGSSSVSVTHYQAGSIAMLPAYQRLQMGYEASGNYVAQNMAQYEAAMKKFEDKMNDKLSDDRKAEGLKQLLAGIVSATVGTALILATAGTAAPIVFFSATVVGGTSTLYGLSNATEGMNNISLGFSGDGFTMAENPIRDTLFAGNPELYYTIGNASTMISAMALPLSGILKGTTGAAKFKTIAVDGGRILIGNVAEDKAYDVIYQSTDSRILAMLGSNVVEGVLSGNPANSSVSEIGDVARKTDLDNYRYRLESESIYPISEVSKVEMPEINTVFNYKSKFDEKEFARQLENQEKGLNSLTIAEFVENRKKYNVAGRNKKANQFQKELRDKFKQDKIEELFENGMSYDDAVKVADEWIKSKAVLHNPDQIAGGNSMNLTGLGDKNVNSSLGAQWRYRIDDLEKQIMSFANKIPENEWESIKLNIKLTYIKKGE